MDHTFLYLSWKTFEARLMTKASHFWPREAFPRNIYIYREREEGRKREKGRRGRKKLGTTLEIWFLGFLEVLKVRPWSFELFIMPKQFYSMLIQVKIWFELDLRFMDLMSWKKEIVEVEYKFSSIGFQLVMIFACYFLWS